MTRSIITCKAPCKHFSIGASTCYHHVFISHNKSASTCKHFSIGASTCKHHDSLIKDIGFGAYVNYIFIHPLSLSLSLSLFLRKRVLRYRKVLAGCLASTSSSSIEVSKIINEMLAPASTYNGVCYGF